MESKIIINVAWEGAHYFRIEKPARYYSPETQKLVVDTKQRYPESEGFKVTATLWKCEGQPV